MHSYFWIWTGPTPTANRTCRTHSGSASPHVTLLPLPSLLRLGKTNSVVAKVVDRVPLPQESITENDQGTGGLWDIQAHEGADAAALDLEDVVVRADGEVVAGESEGEIGKRVTLVALDGVLAVEALLGTDLLVEQLSEGVGRAMREVPVSRMTPVLSSSAVSSPKVMASRSTSQ